MHVVNVLLRLVPYILSIAGGIIVFDISQRYLHNDGWINLLDNVAASLLAIPLVFLFYEYSNYLITRRVQKRQRINLIKQIDDSLFKILTQIQNITGIKRFDIPIGDDIRIKRKRINPDPHFLRAIRRQLNFLEILLYKSDKTDVLDSQQEQTLSFIAQELNQFLNDCKDTCTPRDVVKNIKEILSTIDDWFYSTGYTIRKRQK